MYNYPVLIHYHRKDEAYQSCNFSKRPADSVEFVKEQEYFGEKFSFTHQVETPLELMVFTVDKDGVSKEYPIRFNYYPLLTEVWILDGDATVYYSENPAIASPHYKDQNPFAFDKRLTVLVLITIGATKESWDARFPKKKQALNFGRQQQQLYKL